VKRRAVIGGLIVAAAIAVILMASVGCGGSDDWEAGGGDDGGRAPDHAGTAPALRGRHHQPAARGRAAGARGHRRPHGEHRDLKGHPVLVTFVYSHCPDVCPLIMDNLRRVREDSGSLGKQMRVLAVSVDPKGDTPDHVRGFLADHRVQGFVDYLIGDRPTLEGVWSDWQISEQAPKDDPEAIEHSSLIYGVTASGELATAYPVGFEAEAIARDLPLLAEQ
jgi:protein SCO1/2